MDLLFYGFVALASVFVGNLLKASSSSPLQPPVFICNINAPMVNTLSSLNEKGMLGLTVVYVLELTVVRTVLAGGPAKNRKGWFQSGILNCQGGEY